MKKEIHKTTYIVDRELLVDHKDELKIKVIHYAGYSRICMAQIKPITIWDEMNGDVFPYDDDDDHIDISDHLNSEMAEKFLKQEIRVDLADEVTEFIMQKLINDMYVNVTAEGGPDELITYESVFNMA